MTGISSRRAVTSFFKGRPPWGKSATQTMSVCREVAAALAVASARLGARTAPLDRPATGTPIPASCSRKTGKFATAVPLNASRNSTAKGRPKMELGSTAAPLAIQIPKRAATTRSVCSTRSATWPRPRGIAKPSSARNRAAPPTTNAGTIWPACWDPMGPVSVSLNAMGCPPAPLATPRPTPAPGPTSASPTMAASSAVPNSPQARAASRTRTVFWASATTT